MNYVTRFAPSPTGPLHLGHAFSALTAFDRARQHGGTFLLRIEDIDRDRSRAEYEALIYEDLHWLGLNWPEPVLRQSDRMPAYAAALEALTALGLCYPCRCSRADIRAALSAPQEGAPVHGPDGLVYPGNCRGRSMSDAGPNDSIRLDMARAVDHLATLPAFNETGSLHEGRHQLDRETLVHGVGDLVLARRDMGTSYHLSVVVDDAEQAITEVVRGADLFEASQIHVLLQALLGLPHPDYHHHRLIRDETGKRLAKRDDARAIRLFREEGATAADLRAMVGL
ncbi:tRNA glutamyl-Q(34) synthetase GluQRS [Pseudoruegeria sp. HB172150]|uniref:tRNA glutamyl-Q(34) synthetase GluQRS n=1 Tax=Pseudoruegeria sp. HB172150 TaxID=2721164 RepID=UPI001557142C